MTSTTRSRRKPVTKMAGPDQVLSYHDAILYSSDVRLFKAPNWLNDSCINFYLRYLEHEECKGRPDLLFMDPAVVSCMMIQCTGELKYSSSSWRVCNLSCLSATYPS